MKITLRKINTGFTLVFMYWIIFEWPLLSRINNLSIISAVRSVVDLLPFLLMTLNILFQKWKMQKYELAIFDILLSISVIVSISALINGYSPLTAIELVSVSFRYVPFLVLIRLSTPKITAKIYRHVRVIFWFMVVISIIEIMNKALFMELLLPDPSIFGESLPTVYYGRNIEISGTFINTIDFSFFIIALSCFYIVQTKKKAERVIVFVTALVLLFLSFSVAALLCMMLAGVFLFRERRSFLIFAGIILVAVVVANPRIVKLLTDADSIQSFIKVSNDYSRVGFFTRLMPEFFKGDPKDVFFGLGLAADVVDSKLSGYKNLPLILTFGDNNIKLLKDVYWIGIIATEGIIVFLLYMMVFYVLKSRSRKVLPGNKTQLPKVMIFMVVFLGFFNQVLDVKSFSFCFWVMMGTMIKAGYQNRQFANLQTTYLQASNDAAERNTVKII